NLVAVASALAKEPVRRRAEPAPSPPPSRTVPAMTVVDNAVYVDGRRFAEPDSLDVTYELLRDCGGMAWIGLYRPDETEVRSVAEEFGLHELAVEDAIKAHQRPKLERYDDILFTVLRPARYRDEHEQVEF